MWSAVCNTEGPRMRSVPQYLRWEAQCLVYAFPPIQCMCPGTGSTSCPAPVEASRSLASLDRTCCIACVPLRLRDAGMRQARSIGHRALRMFPTACPFEPSISHIRRQHILSRDDQPCLRCQMHSVGQACDLRLHTRRRSSSAPHKSAAGHLERQHARTCKAAP